MYGIIYIDLELPMVLLAVSREVSGCCLGAGISAELSPCSLGLLGYAASETHLLSAHSLQACCVPAQLPTAPDLASEDRETGQRRSQTFLGKCSTPSPKMLLLQVYNNSQFLQDILFLEAIFCYVPEPSFPRSFSVSRTLLGL